MKNVVPSPITDENFSQAWDYANRKLKELHRKKLIRKILVLVANTLFLISAISLVFGFLTTIPSTTIAHILSTLGPLKKLGEIVAPLIYRPDLKIAEQIAIYFGVLFLPAILASLIVFLVVWFFYHPTQKNQQTEDRAIDSKTLVDILFELQVRKKKINAISSAVSAFIFTIVLYALTLAMLFYLGENPTQLSTDPFFINYVEQAASSPALMILFQVLVGNREAMMLVLLATYIGLNLILSSILTPLYQTKTNTTLNAEAKAYYYECNPAIKEAYEEEERILQKALEIKLKRKQEEEDLLAKINYVNPVYKYIKIAIIVTILIIVMTVGGNKLKSLNIDKLLNEIGVESIEGNTESTETESGTEVTHE